MVPIKTMDYNYIHFHCFEMEAEISKSDISRPWYIILKYNAKKPFEVNEEIQ